MQFIETKWRSGKMELKKIEFSDARINTFYKSIWGNNSLDLSLRKKRTSCEFNLKNDSIEQTLRDIFEIENKKLFEEKLDQAVSGDGKEENKIINMRSSSLCSLLFFYNVTKSNKLQLELNGDVCIFEESLFEFKNEVIRNPSNMDVVLLGHNNNGEKVILFLESKFGEYYFDITKLNQNYDVPYSYYQKYQTLYEKIEKDLSIKSDFEMKKKSSGKMFEIYPERNEHYIGGIKQMISHYIGVENFAKGEYVNANNSRMNIISKFIKTKYSEQELLDKLRDDSEIYLAEIVFDKGIGDIKISENVTYLSDYENLHKELSMILTKDNKIQNVHIVNDLLHYSDYRQWNHKIENKIIEYYFGQNN